MLRFFPFLNKYFFFVKIADLFGLIERSAERTLHYILLPYSILPQVTPAPPLHPVVESKASCMYFHFIPFKRNPSDTMYIFVV